MAKTKTQIQYDKELKRIKRFIREATKRGYMFDADEIRNMIPPKGDKRNLAAEVRKLKSITPNVLYKNAKYRDPQTGRITSARKGRTIEQRRAGRKGWERRQAAQGFPDGWSDDEKTILQEVNAILNNDTNSQGHYVLLDKWNDIVNEYGLRGAIQRIMLIPEIKDIMGNMNYASGEALKTLSDQLIDLMASAAPTASDSDLRNRMEDANFVDSIPEGIE